MWQDNLSKRYAKALINSLDQQGLSLLTSTCQLLLDNKKLKHFLSSPTISSIQKNNLLQTIYPNRQYQNFLNLLINKGRLNLLPKITKYYQQELNQKAGLDNAEVFTAYPINEQTMEKIAEIITQKTKTKIKVKNTVNPQISCGFKAITSNYQVEATLANKLQKLTNKQEE